MVKNTSALKLLATNEKFKQGVLTGMILGKTLTKERLHGAGKKKDFKKALAIAAGPLGWLWLAARRKPNEKIEKLKKQLEKYEPKKKSKKKEDEEEEYEYDEEESEDYDDEYGDDDMDYDFDEEDEFY